MSQFSFPNAKTPHFSFSISLLVSDLILLLSFIISHPLYFLYFIFFSPYIFKLLSFLSPLFITTFLLLLALALLLSPDSSSSSSSDSKLGSLLQKCGSVLDKLRPTVSDGQNEDSRCFEELEAYKIVFEAVTFEVGDEEESEEKHCLPDFEKVDAEEKRVGMGKRDENDDEAEEVVEYVQMLQKSQDEKVKAVVGGGAESDKVVGEQGEIETTAAGVSEGMETKIPDNGGDYNSDTSVVKSSEGECYYSPRKDMESSQNLGSFGSMRKEKEWRRTLACKLFEERHNVEGGEGMDSLWETYEADSSKAVVAGGKKSKKKGKEMEVEEEEEEEEDEEGMDRQLCCLQALKFSAGKMNLGMGRPNLVKISKALKGFGWLHQQVSKHGRKAHRRD